TRAHADREASSGSARLARGARWLVSENGSTRSRFAPRDDACRGARGYTLPAETSFTELAMTILELGEAISNSLSYSSILILTAIGLAITFGVMRVINMAHGEMLMLGAYTAFVITDPHYLPLWVHDALDSLGYETSFPFNLFVAIPVSFLVV